MYRLAHLAIAYFFLLIPSQHAIAEDLSNISMITGRQSGTYFRFGQDISRVFQATCGAPIAVKESAGSLENLKRLRNEAFTQLAIIQSDVLQYILVNQEAGREFRDYANKFKIVYALYPEEIHVVTKHGTNIHSLRDLSGKKVAIGEPESGTRLTSLLLLSSLNVQVTPVEIGPKAALDRLLRGERGEEIDAFIAVGGKPYPVLDLEAKAGEELEFVPITENEVFQIYKPATFTNNDYRWLKSDVKTAAVTATLVTFDFQGKSCANVATIAKIVKDNFDELQKSGHPKWNAVALDQDVPGWSRSDCVTEKLRHPFRLSSPNGRCVFLDGDAPRACNCDRFSDSIQHRICELQCQSAAH